MLPHQLTMCTCLHGSILAERLLLASLESGAASVLEACTLTDLDPLWHLRKELLVKLH